MFKNISSKDNISLDNVCYLVSYGESTKDSKANTIKGKPIETLRFCAETSAFSSEFFQAGQKGIKPSTVLLIDSESYGGEEKVKYNDILFSIYRFYLRADGLTELYLSKKIGD